MSKPQPIGSETKVKKAKIAKSMGITRKFSLSYNFNHPIIIWIDYEVGWR